MYPRLHSTCFVFFQGDLKALRAELEWADDAAMLHFFVKRSELDPERVASREYKTVGKLLEVNLNSMKSLIKWRGTEIPSDSQAIYFA